MLGETLCLSGMCSAPGGSVSSSRPGAPLIQGLIPFAAALQEAAGGREGELGKQE